MGEWEMAPSVWSAVAGGAGDERTQRVNRTAVDGWGLVPRMFVGAKERDLTVEVFGLKLPSPVFMAPIGVIGLCAQGGHGLFLRELAAVMPRFANVRRMGSAALDIAYVAAGRLDGYWERGLNTWDFAAGSVLIREAGGTFGTLDGKPVTGAKDVICGNEACEQALRAALKTAAA